LSTITKVPDKSNDLDLHDYNDEIMVRNEIMRSIPLFETKGIELWQNFIKYRYIDRVHFGHEYDQFFAAIIYKKLFGEVDKFLQYAPMRIFSINELNDILNMYNQIYIVGYGRNGKLVQKYFLRTSGILVKCVVTDGFYKLLTTEEKEVVGHFDTVTKKEFAIVTAQDISLQRLLFERNIKYCLLDSNVYIDILYKLFEYVD
jgi:hypothetical protein